MPTLLHRHAGHGARGHQPLALAGRGARGHPPLALAVLLLTVAALLVLLVFGARTAAAAEARDQLVPSPDVVVVVGPRGGVGGDLASGHGHPRPSPTAEIGGEGRDAGRATAVAR